MCNSIIFCKATHDCAIQLHSWLLGCTGLAGVDGGTVSTVHGATLDGGTMEQRENCKRALRPSTGPRRQTRSIKKLHFFCHLSTRQHLGMYIMNLAY